MKEERKPEYPEKTPGDELQRMPHTSYLLGSTRTHTRPKIQAPSETGTRAVALVAGQESRHANHYTTRHPC